MKTVLKIALGIILAFTVLIIGCSALFSAGIDEAEKDAQKNAITLSEYQSVKVGENGNTIARLIARFGKPSNVQRSDDATGQRDLYYWPVKEGGLLDDFQFAVEDGRVVAKNQF